MTAAAYDLTIAVAGASVRLGGKDILTDVSFSAGPGELVGLIGPNGAGKTTLMRAILGLVPLSGGEMRLAGKDLGDQPARDRARSISYLAQGAPVHWPLTVESLVAIGRVPHKTPWQALAPEDSEAIEAAMAATGVSDFRNRIVTSLSGGERARVMLARALATGAPYLFADEPAASFDPHYQLEMMALLKNRIDDRHGGIVVLHDLNLAQHFCDRLLVLSGGRLVADGAPAEILTDTLLDRVFAVKVARWSEAGDSFLVPNALALGEQE